MGSPTVGHLGVPIGTAGGVGGDHGAGSDASAIRVRIGAGRGSHRVDGVADVNVPAALDRYVLPVKRSLRVAEALEPGDIAPVHLELA